MVSTLQRGFRSYRDKNLGNLIGIDTEGKEFEKGGAKGGEVLLETESESEGENDSSVNSRATTNIGFAKVKSGGGFDRNRSKLGKAVINSKRTSLPEDSIFESSAFKLKQTRKPRDRLFLILNSIRFDSTILSLKITRTGANQPLSRCY